MKLDYTRTITRRDGSQFCEFAHPHGGLIQVRLSPGMTIEDARQEAEQKIERIERRVDALLGGAA